MGEVLLIPADEKRAGARERGARSAQVRGQVVRGGRQKSSGAVDGKRCSRTGATRNSIGAVGADARASTGATAGPARHAIAMAQSDICLDG